ncbi:MAG: hypothetical protein ACQJCO_02400 [cyanobacterium endosymbiont of Rhopalodia sterrenbergii]
MVIVILYFCDETHFTLFNQVQVLINFPSIDEVDFIHLEDGKRLRMISPSMGKEISVS